MGLLVDSFAGGGGASTGFRLALGRDVDIAINHDPEAIRMHMANHPGTKHFCESVWNVDPREACGGQSESIQILQVIYPPKCAPCVSAVTEKRYWTAKDKEAPRPYCKNPKSPFFMRIPPCRCDCFQEVICSPQEISG